MSMRSADRPSSDPADVTIVEILDNRRQPTADDRRVIIRRMGKASFNESRRRLPRPLMDLLREHGYEIPERSTELTHHWAKHVIGDSQWSPDTTAYEYVEDLRRAILHPDSHLLVRLTSKGEYLALIVAQTSDVIPRARRGDRFGSELIVVYSAGLGRIVSGYMVTTSRSTIERPGTIWLPK